MLLTPGDFHRVLEREEEALAGPSFGIELEQILARIHDLSVRDLVLLTAGENTRQGALAGAVGAHDGMHLTRVSP